MLISVVIPTMNKVDLLKRTLSALRDQDLPADLPWEIVVVNDASTDGTGDFLATAAAADGSRLHVVTAERNVGRARARNLGGRAARGRWLIFLDDDIVAPPDLLREHLEILKQEPHYGTIGYAVTSPDLIDAPHFHYLDTRGVARMPAGPAPARYFVTQNAGIPREAFLSIGGFDEDFAGYGFEDMEIAFRLEDQAGLEFQVLPRPVPIHVHHHTLAEYLDKKIACGRQSLRHVARLHPERLKQMRLHHIVTADGRPARSLLAALVDLPGMGGLRKVLATWPRRTDRRPVFFKVYCQLMTLLILRCYREGLKSSQ